MRRRFFNINDTSNKYLTIVALEDGLTASLSTNDCEYCIDGSGVWVTLAASTATPSINAGQTLSFRANLTPSSSHGIGTFTILKRCNLEGNCMSMLFANNISLYCFYKLFFGCTTIVNVSPNFLPATTLADSCYSNMFNGCYSLTTAPELPATTLAVSCYSNMFNGCYSLTTAPELPATTLADSCYSNMFNGCYSLTTAPVLPATTLIYGCYGSMFQGCTSLTSTPALPATTLADNCYYSMFYNCTSLTSAPELPATTLARNCYSNMFSGCTGLTVAPELPATTLAYHCYYYMFRGCTSLTTSPELPAKSLVNGCYESMFSATNILPDCSNIDFTSNTVVTSGGLRGLFAGTKVTDNDLERLLPKNSNGRYCLPATTLAYHCYENMFYNCTSLTTSPELPATTLASYCYQSMFYGCKALTTAPELPATTLAVSCYYRMFRDCTKLNYIKMLATDISAIDCLNNWVSGVASIGTFVKHSDMEDLPTGISGIPSGWNVVNDGEDLTFPVTLVEGNNGQLGIDVFNHLFHEHHVGGDFTGEIYFRGTSYSQFDGRITGIIICDNNHLVLSLQNNLNAANITLYSNGIVELNIYG